MTTVPADAYTAAEASAAEDRGQGSGRLFFWTVMGACLTAAGVFYAAGQVLLAVAVAGLPLVLGTLVYPRIGLYAYIALQAWDTVLLTSIDAVLTPAKALGFLILAGYLVAALREPILIRRAKTFIVLSLTYSCWGAATALFCLAPFAAIRYAGQDIVQAMLLLATIHLVQTREQIQRLLFWGVMGGTTAAVTMLMLSGIGGQSRSALGEFANANTTGMALGIALMCVPAVWPLTASRTLRLLYAPAAVVMLVAIMATGSRSATFGVFFAFVVGGLFTKQIAPSTKALVTIVALGLTATVFLVTLSAEILDSKSQERLEAFVNVRPGEFSQESRWTIWGHAVATYLDYPLIGVGMGNTRFAMERKYGVGRDIHNSFLAAPVETGPVGALLFFWAMIELARRVRGIGLANPGIAAAMLLAFMAFNALTHTIHHTKWFWIPATICLLLAERRELFLNPTQEEPLGDWHTEDATGGDVLEPAIEYQEPYGRLHH